MLSFLVKRVSLQSWVGRRPGLGAIEQRCRSEVHPLRRMKGWKPGGVDAPDFLGGVDSAEMGGVLGRLPRWGGALQGHKPVPGSLSTALRRGTSLWGPGDLTTVPDTVCTCRGWCRPSPSLAEPTVTLDSNTAPVPPAFSKTPGLELGGGTPGTRRRGHGPERCQERAAPTRRLRAMPVMLVPSSHEG